MLLEELPEKLDGLYLLYKGSVKYSQERGFSPEAAFWIAFAEICPSTVWNEDASTEVKLSEVLRLYLSIYCEQVNHQMTIEEEPQFLEPLKKRYDKVNWIFFESHSKEPGLAALDLGRLILGKDANVFRQLEVGANVVSAANVLAAECMPLKLVRDI